MLCKNGSGVRGQKPKKPWTLVHNAHAVDVDRYNDPVDLASLDISEEGKNEVEVYAAGQLKNLRSSEGQVSGIEVKDDHTLVNITVRVRLLRTSYLWTSSFFTEGILSMYYTCGQKLPLAIFKVSLAGYVPCVKTGSGCDGCG